MTSCLYAFFFPIYGYLLPLDNTLLPLSSSHFLPAFNPISSLTIDPLDLIAIFGNKHLVLPLEPPSNSPKNQ
jgi:hypothetical protein